VRRRGGGSVPLVALSRGRRLSEGGVIQASVRARLFGIPLLRLDATVALIPATTTVSPSRVQSGRSLEEAVRRINEGAEVLEHVRRDGRGLSLEAALAAPTSATRWRKDGRLR
jgi:hypothetical protein